MWSHLATKEAGRCSFCLERLCPAKNQGSVKEEGENECEVRGKSILFHEKYKEKISKWIKFAQLQVFLHECFIFFCFNITIL